MLEGIFKSNQYPDVFLREELAASTKLSEARIQVSSAYVEALKHVLKPVENKVLFKNLYQIN